MSVLPRANNVFDLSGPSPHLKDTFNAINRNKTRDQLKQHFGSDLYDKVSSIIATDINTYNSPAAQTMMDVYHHWSLHSKQNKTWNDFINTTSLSHIRKNNINIFSQLQDYQYHYTSNTYAPLSEYKGPVLPGDANDSVMKVYEIYNHLKLRKTQPNTCLQVDVRLTPNINSSSVQSNLNEYNDEDDESSDDDDDDEYAIEYTQNLPSEYNFPSKKAPVKPNDFSSSTPNIQKSSSKSNIAQKAELETTDLTDAGASIDNIMRKWKLDEEPYSYKRYEMLYKMESNKMTTFEAISNNTLPQCSFRNSPLCRISNSTNSTQEIMNHLNPAGTMMNLLTFSYHLLNDCIQLYMYINSGDKLYGSRIFREDLFTTIPGLFERKTVDKHTKEELNAYLEFKDDKIYDEYRKVLFKRNAGDLNQNIYELSDKMTAQLVEFVYSWNDKNGRLFHIDLDKITRIFRKNKINYTYFESMHRTKFVKLLQRKGISTCIANELWLEFGGHLQDDNDCKSCMEEKSENQSVSTNSSDVSIIYAPSKLQNNQIQRLQKQLQNVKRQLIQKNEEREQFIAVIQKQKRKINDLKQRNKLQAQQIDVLRRRGLHLINTDNDLDEYKENDIGNMRQLTSSSDSSVLDRLLRMNSQCRFLISSNPNNDNNNNNICNDQSSSQPHLRLQISISRVTDENDWNYQPSPEAVFVCDVSSTNCSDHRYQQSMVVTHDYKWQDDANNDIDENDPNYQVTPEAHLVEVIEQSDYKREERKNTEDDTKDNHQSQENELPQSRVTIPSFNRPILQEFTKWEMTGNSINALERYYNTSLIPQRQQELEEKININQQTLAAIQAPILMNIYHDAWQTYCLWCICIILNEGFKNLYQILMEIYNLSKKSNSSKNE